MEPAGQADRGDRPPLILVVSGPGGVGKGTVVGRLVAEDPTLWLSQSWTTRPRRPAEPEDAYHFVDRRTFEAKRASGGFLESAEFLGHSYGTPLPSPPAGSDVVLEIDVQGARQVRAAYPDSVVVLVVAPTPAEQAARLAARGDPPSHVERRLDLARAEELEGMALADHVLVNDDLESALAELRSLVALHRSAEPTGS
ncbi:MAG: guanylate kinase [Acidimicrobiales bacterium]